MFGGQMKSRLRVGFFPPSEKKWMGGVNYYKNLFFALKKYLSSEIEIVIFLSKKYDKNIVSIYSDLVDEVVFLESLTRKSFSWLLTKVESRLIGTNYFLARILKEYRVDFISHSKITNIPGIRVLIWIPDFQHINLPDMFSAEEVKNRNRSFNKLIKESDGVILSSYDALNDLRKFSPYFENKAHVLQFVSQPEGKFFELVDSDKVNLQSKYKLPEKFFYLPNQFWKHKNHLLAFEAIRILYNKGLNPCLVCTGSLEDLRHSEYVNTIKNFIHVNKLEGSIRLLGLVDYQDVFSLMKFSEVVINPSLFEGWSSTVEECKSIGKSIVLSDINVHKEQIPNGIFFNRYDPESLAYILESGGFIDPVETSNSLEQRSKHFADQFLLLAKSI
jgi:glycosyltransferase involved in cell wall biosynthesis